MNIDILTSRLGRSCIPFLAVLTVGLAASEVSSAKSAQNSLTLVDATQRTLNDNPQLHVFRWRSEALRASRQTANLRPAYQVALEAENMMGSGEYSGTDRAELTVSLSSVIELGDKRQSRVAVAESRAALAHAEEKANALGTLSQVTQSFIAALALQEKLSVAKDATELAATTYQLIDQRADQGATTEAERLRADATLKMARLKQDALAAQLQARKLTLATLWGDEHVNFGALEGDLFRFETADDLASLYRRVSSSPEIRILASEARLREAEVSLARSQSDNNVRWSLGVKRFDESGDSALTAGISVPLFSGKRNRGNIESARAKSEAARFQQESALLRVRARLFEAWQTYQQSSAAAKQMRSDVLPTLEKALEQTRRGYQRGRYGYIEWVTAQRELLDARLAAIDAASTALLNQALIEQLTAQPLAGTR